MNTENELFFSNLFRPLGYQQMQKTLTDTDSAAKQNKKNT